jgi:hypothetical protein
VATWPPDFGGFRLALERYVALTLYWVRLPSPAFVNLCVMGLSLERYVRFWFAV